MTCLICTVSSQECTNLRTVLPAIHCTAYVRITHSHTPVPVIHHIGEGVVKGVQKVGERLALLPSVVAAIVKVDVEATTCCGTAVAAADHSGCMHGRVGCKC